MSNDERSVLPITQMHERHYGLTTSRSAALIEALRVCLDRHHQPPVEFTILERDQVVWVEWEVTNARARAAHANEHDATTDGAYACVIAALELADGLVAVGRAPHRTGADYYVASSGFAEDDFEDVRRLEVSGTDRGSHSELSRRLAEKVDQLRRGVGEEDGIAGVVGFRERLIRFEWVDAQ